MKKVYYFTPKEIAPTAVPIPRINLKCWATQLEGEESSVAKELFIEKHPVGKDILEKEEFNYYQLDPLEIFFLNG